MSFLGKYAHTTACKTRPGQWFFIVPQALCLLAVDTLYSTHLSPCVFVVILPLCVCVGGVPYVYLISRFERR
jgi:hypothetical protein